MVIAIMLDSGSINKMPFHTSETRTFRNAFLTNMAQVTPRPDEPIDKALKRLKKQLDREDVLRECRRRRHFQKPSAVKRQKMKEAKFKAYLKSRYED